MWHKEDWEYEHCCEVLTFLDIFFGRRRVCRRELGWKRQLPDSPTDFRGGKRQCVYLIWAQQVLLVYRYQGDCVLKEMTMQKYWFQILVFQMWGHQRNGSHTRWKTQEWGLIHFTGRSFNVWKVPPSLSFSSWRQGTGHTPESTGGDLRFLVPPHPRKAIKEGQRVLSSPGVLQTQKPSVELLILSPQSYLHPNANTILGSNNTVLILNNLISSL